MRFYAVSPVGVVGADYKFLTYASDLDLAAGQIVEIPVGRRRMAGVILKTVEPPSFACKEITRPIFQQTLPEPLLVLHNWLSEYYIAHPGTVWQTMLPAGLLKNHRPAKNPEKFIKNSGENRTKIVYTADQKRAIDEFEKMPTGTGILLGRTGSGKTAVYKKLAQDAIKAGRSAMILVPEIALTTQLVENFRRDFPNVILTHSTMTDAQRFMIWQKVLESDRPAVIIGPRSALFLPVKNLGLVVVD
ncbi:MAG: DEAD/DEAH box helicase family protein, partial [Candidatus Nomurabacteria bacterium]|nr:DEAD/DEAH box helicase family protein [Candidatus Nomurabacteria bacterium]